MLDSWQNKEISDDIIRTWRKDQDFTKREGNITGRVSKKAGISRATLSKLENGYMTRISVAALDKILDLLGHTIDIKPKTPFVKR